MPKKIALIDCNSRRRAEISQALSPVFFVDPYGSASEFAEYWPGPDSALLVHDETSHVEEISDLMRMRRDWLPAIAYGVSPSVDRVTDVMQSGWLGYLGFPFEDTESIQNRLITILARANRQFEQRKRQIAAKGLIDNLSPREFEVIKEVSKGATNKQIALELNISPRTVEIHRSNMLNKLGGLSSADAVRIAIEAGIDDQAETNNFAAVATSIRQIRSDNEQELPRARLS